MITRTFLPLVFSDTEANFSFTEPGSTASTLPLDVNQMGQDNAAAYADACEQIAIGKLRILLMQTLSKFAIAGNPYTLTDVQNDMNTHIADLAVTLDLESQGAVAYLGPATP